MPSPEAISTDRKPASGAATDTGRSGPVVRRARFPAIVLATLMVAGLVALVSRNVGLQPAILADDWYYSKMARLQPLSEAIVPSYLYLWLFGASNACGPRFLDCARLGNALFHVGAAPFVYLVARTVTGPRLALCAAALSLLAPLNLYTTFFMPEPMYYFGFCVLSWIALTRTRWHWAAYALATGAVFGLLSLVKVHALFLLPALGLFVLYVPAARGAGLRALLLACAAALAVRFGLGYLLAGDAGLDLIGSLYGAAARRALTHSPAQLLPRAFFSAKGHLMALAVILALPLALLARMAVSRAARLDAGPRLVRLQLYALLMLGAALGMTVAFTATAPPADLARLQLRYYSFVFPLLFIVGAAQLGRAGPRRDEIPARTIAVMLGALLVVAVSVLPRYSLSMPDGPDIAGIDLHDWTGRLLVGLDLLVLFLWARGSRLAAPLFLFAALPLALLVADRAVQLYARHPVPASAAARAGQFAHLSCVNLLTVVHEPAHYNARKR